MAYGPAACARGDGPPPLRALAVVIKLADLADLADLATRLTCHTWHHTENADNRRLRNGRTGRAAHPVCRRDGRGVPAKPIPGRSQRFPLESPAELSQVLPALPPAAVPAEFEQVYLAGPPHAARGGGAGSEVTLSLTLSHTHTL